MRYWGIGGRLLLPLLEQVLDLGKGEEVHKENKEKKGVGHHLREAELLDSGLGGKADEPRLPVEEEGEEERRWGPFSTSFTVKSFPTIEGPSPTSLT